jgi:hypothetical protein
LGLLLYLTKLPKVNNRQMGENSPNLVTLPNTHFEWMQANQLNGFRPDRILNPETTSIVKMLIEKKANFVSAKSRLFCVFLEWQFSASLSSFFAQ